MDQQSQQLFLTLLETQRWKREAVVTHQLRLLEQLCRHAREHVPFYRDSGRLAPLFDRADRFDFGGWTELPVLTRAEAWRSRDALHAEKVLPAMQPLILGSTTGSTGTPLPFYRTAVSRTMAEAQLARALVWRKLGVLNPIVISKAVSGDAAGSEWAPSAGGAIKSDGAVHYVDFHDAPGDQVAELAAIRPRLILSYPSIALSWIEAGCSFAGLHALVLTGETCSPEMRKRIAKAFKGEIVEVYSASETGPIAMEQATPRGASPVLAVCEENVFLEGAIPDGGAGEPQPLIVTPFYSFGTPLIRYAPGDHVVLSTTQSAAAPGLRRITRVAGRLRNMFRRADGSGFWPNLSGVRLMRIAPHTHRQLIQEDYQRFVMRVVFDSPPSQTQIDAIRAHVAEVTGGTDIVVEAVAAIEDGRAHGKSYENFVCLLPDPAS